VTRPTIAVACGTDGGAVRLAVPRDLDGRRVRLLLLLLLLGSVVAGVVVLGPAIVGGSPTRGESQPAPAGDRTSPVLPARPPESLLAEASASIGASDRAYWPRRDGDSMITQGGGIRGRFTRSAVVASVPLGTLELSLATAGRIVSAGSSGLQPTSVANQVIYRHGLVADIYRAGPYGLEQSFTVFGHRLASRHPLVLSLQASGTLVPEQVGGGILFRTRAGAVALRYDDLRATDASGRRLAAKMSVGHGTVQLRVAASGARYPIHVDPFIQQGAKLTGGGEAGSGEFGSSVALSADGNTALVGAPGDGGGVGAAWVFTRSGSTWTQQGEKLTGAPEASAARFGGSVSLSEDGNTALVGAPGDSGRVGAAWVFTRSGSTWTQQGEKLTGAGESGPGAFGQSVALSSDGSTALIGGPMDNPMPQPSIGAAWVFTRSSATWTQQGDKLTGAGEIGPARFGSSVTLSSDGNTAMIGGPYNLYCIGAVWILLRSGGVWNEQALLSGITETSACNDGPDDGSLDELEFGYSVALSANGNVGLISQPFREWASREGGAWSYARAGSSWSEQTPLRNRNGARAAGSSVAVSADGQQILLGKGEAGGSDSALAFVRAGAEWAQEGSALLASDAVGFASFGDSVALSSSASTALVGGSSDNGNIGAAWVFTKPVLPPPTALTGLASSLTDVSAALNGTVNPNGQEVFNCHFEYGSTISYGSSTSCWALPGAGESPVEVSASAKGLTANTTYHFRIVAASGGGVAYGGDETLTTLPDPPAVVTGAASSITPSAARLNATVNPLGEAVSDCRFEYGNSASYGSSVPCSPMPGSGSGAVEVSAAVVSLSENSAYHFRIVATNPTGTSYGSDRTFDTLSSAPEYGRCTEVAPGAGRYANNACTKWGSGMRYEWHPGALGVHFTLAAGAAAFESVKRSLITCKAGSGSGEYAGRKTLGGVILTFTGCEQLGEKCTSTLAAEGEIVTNLLEGVLGVEHLGRTTVSNKIGLELLPVGEGATFMELSCGITTVTLRGAVIVPCVANKMQTVTTLKYSASRGKQRPERFVGEPAAILEASFGNKAFEQTGVTFEATQTSGESLEANSSA